MYQCKRADCVYRCSFTETCDYYLITGHRRQSPARRCARYVRRGGVRLPAVLDSAADEVLLQSLYDAGLSDRQIAKELHLPPHAVGAWRRQRQLPSQKDLLYT